MESRFLENKLEKSQHREIGLKLQCSVRLNESIQLKRILARVIGRFEKSGFHGICLIQNQSSHIHVITFGSNYAFQIPLLDAFFPCTDSKSPLWFLLFSLFLDFRRSLYSISHFLFISHRLLYDSDYFSLSPLFSISLYIAFLITNVFSVPSLTALLWLP